eukprot:6963906-Prymnesium_polylepis.1
MRRARCCRRRRQRSRRHSSEHVMNPARCVRQVGVVLPWRSTSGAQPHGARVEREALSSPIKPYSCLCRTLGALRACRPQPTTALARRKPASSGDSWSCAGWMRAQTYV